ncbi:MAG TPA: hypothetical protein VK008_04135 [Sphingobacteriaceae bacterium]|nr:hypothetical protein [Sphingobacteriaceae bacterium]
MVAARPLRREEFWDGPATTPGRRRRRKPVSRPRRSARGEGQSPRRQRRAQARFKPQAGFLLTLGIVALLLFGIGVRYASLSSTGRQLVALKEELARLEDEKAKLMADISTLGSPGRVESGAVQSLGMTRPLEIRSVQVARLEAVPQAPVLGDSAVIELARAPEAAGEQPEGAQAGWLDRSTQVFYQWLSGSRAEAGAGAPTWPAGP